MFEQISRVLPSTLVLTLGLFSAPAQAQISADGTVNTVVTTDGNSFTIEGGTTSGTNLFHSFSEFDLPTGSEAFFNNATSITNIFSRVTGGSFSDIDGLIRGNGVANLFLINPNGITFGENASINIGGSFFATTAETVVFSDNIEFSATDTSTTPLLTVSVPVGLQYGSNPSSIEVQGANLTVPPQQTLSLTGGDITLTNGNLMTEQGRVELGSVDSPGLVSLISTKDGFALRYEETESFGDINLNQSSIIDVSGEGAGNIHLQGRAINILDDSYLVADTLGAQDGGSIIIKASESVEFFDTDTTNTTVLGTDGNPLNGIDAKVSADATGRGADVIIETNLLRIANGAQIFLDTSSISDTGNLTIKATDLIMSELSNIFILIQADATGNGGEISVEVEQLDLRDASQIGSDVLGAGNGSNVNVKALSIDARGETEDGVFTSLIFSTVNPGGTGNAGNIFLETKELRFQEGAQIFTGTFGEGNAGNIEVRANSIELIGESSIFGFPSAILASATQAIPEANPNAGRGELRGIGGNINIETEMLQIRDGGGIFSSTASIGDAGNITIQATEMELIGTTPNNTFGSLLSTTSHRNATGNGGDIQLNVERLSVRDGGQILASTRGLGHAGNIEINATQIEVSGTSEDGAILSDINASSVGEGAAGSIAITTDDLTITDRGTMTVSSTGLGDAGNLNITADFINLNNQGSLQAQVTTGNQGNLNLNTTLLILRNQSNMTTNADEQANGGNITLETLNLVALEGSNITANAVFGQGGNISITAQGLFVFPDSQIVSSSEFGVDGVIMINTPDSQNMFMLPTLPTDPMDTNQTVVRGCYSHGKDSFTVTRRGGLPPNPNRFLGSDHILVDLGELSTLDRDDTVNASMQISSIPTSSETIIEANSWRINKQGQVELIAIVPPTGVQTPKVNCDGTT